MSEPTAQVSDEIRATPNEVWKALTTPSLLKKSFMGAEVESDFKVGRPINFRGNFKGKSYQDKQAERAQGRPRLAKLEEEARSKGFLRIARLAREALEPKGQRSTAR